MSESPEGINKALIAWVSLSFLFTTLVLGIFYFRFKRPTEPILQRGPTIAQGPVIAGSPQKEVKDVLVLADPLPPRVRSTEKNLRKKQVERYSIPAETLGTKAKSTNVRSTILVPPRPKDQDPMLYTQPTDSAVPHIDAHGIIDYWIVPHGPFFTEEAHVVPIGSSPDGIWVRNLSDRRNYRLTPDGKWYFAQIPH